MAKILKNQTGSAIDIDDTGVSVPASPATYTIPEQDYLLWAASSDIITEVGAGNIVVNDGSQDLSISDGTSLLKGFYPHELVGGTDGTVIGNDGDALKVTSTNNQNNPSIVTQQRQHIDAFNRLRVSNPLTLFQEHFIYQSDFDQHWDTFTVGGGSVDHDPVTGQMILSVGTASGDKAILQSRRRVEYIKGKSQLIMQTGSFNALQLNQKKTMGYGDENNGVFFQTDGQALYVVRRTDVSGSVVDNATPSTSWNIDRLDGSGDENNPSGLQADPTKHYLFLIDFSFLGSNIIRYAIIVDGTIVYIHQENTSGVLETPWMKSGNMPIRYEIENTAATTASQMDVTCLTVISEGGQANIGHVQNVDVGVNAVNVNTQYKAVAGIRLKAGSRYASIKVNSFNLLGASGKNFLYWQVIYGGTFTTMNWTPITEVTEGLTNNPTYTQGSGYQIDSGYMDLNNGTGKNRAAGAQDEQVETDIYLGFDIPGNADYITLVCRTTSGSGSIYFSGSFTEFV